MRRSWLGTWLGSSIALVAAPSSQAQTAIPAAPAAPAKTLQQMFDQALDAEAAGNCSAALPLLEQLSGDRRVKPGTLPLGLLELARGRCLSTMDRDTEAEAPLLTALPILEKAGSDYLGARVLAERQLGEIAASQWRHDDAIAHLSSALALLKDKSRIAVLVRLAIFAMFDGDGKAQGWLDEALVLAGPEDKTNRDTLASIHTIRGRLLMNQGRNKDALAELKLALRLAGGLTTEKVTLTEVAMRGDLAQAELLNGDKDQARTYLAYTGSGRIAQSPFAYAERMDPPPCGPETGLKPSDSAVVELVIGKNGDVAAARTVYTTGNYAVAAAFAKAVGQWYWQPESLARIPDFYKALTRVELRCSAAAGARPGILAPLNERFQLWAQSRLPQEADFSGKIGVAKARLGEWTEQRLAAGDKAAAVAGLVTLGLAEAPAPGSPAIMDRAMALMADANLPAEVQNAVVSYRGMVAAAVATMASRKRRRDVDQVLLQTAESPAMAADPLAQDTLRLLAAPDLPSPEQRPPSNALLTRVANDDRLPAHHPLRQNALLRLADAAAQNGDFAAAQDYFSRTGLSAQQCALLGPKPSMRSDGASGQDFPIEALQMGFEGWVRLEFDISANGKTANPRALIAYPPFVFVDAANGMTRGIRYAASYRPGTDQACSANIETIRFIIPSAH